MRWPTTVLICAGAMLCALACARQAPPTAAAPAASSSGADDRSRPRVGMQVEGIMGKIPERRIEETMQAKLPAFQHCFFDATADPELAFVSGHMKFYFRVGLDGRVESVHPRGSSIGHRGTELCLLGIARQTRFPKPQGGGAAEFVWGFELEGLADVRTPVAWPAAHVAGVVRSSRGSLGACGLGSAHYIVTAYVAPGGHVISAGGAADSQEAADKIDCIVAAVKTWSMPDPGSYPAKVSFKL